ncbi:MAG TPA: alpha/beta fold hydrolase [Ktedonobacteraceae bacterium]
MARDERVQSAIDNWAPRFIANGIDYNDFQYVTTHVERWEDWCRAWSERGAFYERMGEQAEAAGNGVSIAYHYLHASMAYHFGKFLFVSSPDELREAHEHVVSTYKRALPHCDFPGERVEIPYENGASMYGILRRPSGTATVPVVIIVPGLDSVKEEMHNYGDDLLRRGMAVLALDGPGQGEMEFNFAMRYDYEVPVKYAVDYLENCQGIDPSRIGLMGVSLGGYYASRAASFEPRLRAVIENCGGYDIARHFSKRPFITRAAFVARSRSANEAEAMETLKNFNLSGVLKNITCPLLVIQGRLDRLVPAEDGERIAADTKSVSELWMFEDGNHVCNNIPFKHRPQQSDWMRTKLGA